MMIKFALLTAAVLCLSACDDSDPDDTMGSAGSGSSGVDSTETATAGSESSTETDSSTDSGAGSTSGVSTTADSPDDDDEDRDGACEGQLCGAACPGPAGPDPVVGLCDENESCQQLDGPGCPTCEELGGCGEPCAENGEAGFCDTDNVCDLALAEPPECG